MGVVFITWGKRIVLEDLLRLCDHQQKHFT